jgi:predicted ATP-dependent serine protease
MYNTCQICGELKSSNSGLCESCKEEYNTIRSYIEKSPRSTLMDISNSTRLSLKKIRLFVERGHFDLKE